MDEALTALLSALYQGAFPGPMGQRTSPSQDALEGYAGAIGSRGWCLIPIAQAPRDNQPALLVPTAGDGPAQCRRDIHARSLYEELDAACSTSRSAAAYEVPPRPAASTLFIDETPAGPGVVR